MLKISVIIPCFKDSLINVTIKNILKKLSNNDEIIIVGKCYSNFQDTRIKKIDGKFYAGQSRNIGALNAKGDILVFIDCGVLPKKIYYNIKDDELLFPICYPIKNKFLLGTFIDWPSLFLKEILNIDVFIHTKFFIVKKNTFLRKKLFFKENIHYSEDNLWIKKIKNKINIKIIKDNNYFYEPLNIKKFIKKIKLYAYGEAKIKKTLIKRISKFILLNLYFIYIPFHMLIFLKFIYKKNTDKLSDFFYFLTAITIKDILYSYFYFYKLFKI